MDTDTKHSDSDIHGVRKNEQETGDTLDIDTLSETYETGPSRQPVVGAASDSSDDITDDIGCFEAQSFIDEPKLYFRKIEHSATSKSGRRKKHKRVYNTYQYCWLCSTKVSSFAQHMRRKHKNNIEVSQLQNLPDIDQKRALCLMRLKYSNKYNMSSLKKGKGEIFLER